MRDPEIPEPPPAASAPPVVLTIAGSDSGGGAGIQADLKTFQAFGVFGTTAVTAVTAQNTVGVQAIELVSPDLVRAQIRAVCDDLDPVACKTGMLGNEAGIRATVEAIRACGLGLVVVDPVMVATSGDPLLAPSAIAALRDELLPLATLVTPNVPEARLLAGIPVEGEAGMRQAARRLVSAGAGAALIKGGHLAGDDIVDLFWDGRRERVFRTPRISTRHTHGTGCTLSAAATARLALGDGPAEAVDTAIRYTHEAIRSAPGLGGGHGPLEHRIDPATLRREPRCS